jgi:phosphonate metabolism protein (transferase hexapeptide repeat family)
MPYITQFPEIPSDTKPHELSEEPYIHPTCVIKNSTLGAYTSLAAHTTLVESSFGDYSYTAGNVQIIYSEIGKYCSIANSVRINPGNHPQWRVTQHHMTYRRVEFGLGDKDDHAFFDWRRAHKCVIGHDAWLGHGVIVMPGVHIGIGAIIGSGAVVTKNIGPYEIAVGVPAKVIKKRFSDPIVEQLLSSEWWLWDRQTLEQNFDDLLDINQFIAKHTSSND